MFYTVALLRTIAQDTASQIALRSCSKEVREEPGFIGVFAGKKQNRTKHVVEHQKSTANHKKTRHLKLMILVLFYVWENARVRAH